MANKKEVIITTREQQQRYLMNWAVISVRGDGRQWEARMDVISMIRAIKGHGVIAEFDDRSQELFNKTTSEVLEEVNEKVAILVSYYSDIKKSVLDKEDVSSPRFIKYQEALSKCYKYLFFLDELIVSLQKDIDLETFTIPSHYFSYVSKDEIIMPSENEGYPEQMENGGGE